MKRKHCISFTILLLFVVALCGRSAASYMCGCDEHSQVHHCCHCPNHVVECEYHDLVASENCFFHAPFSDYEVIALEEEAKSHRPFELLITILDINQVNLDIAIQEEELQDYASRYLAQLIDGIGVSIPLRAPPALM